jgi:hypothetical protein
MADEVPNHPLRKIMAQVRGDPRLKDALGCRQGDEPEDEIEHFYLCKVCHQPVDMRDLAAVFHHEEMGHDPLPVEDALRLLRILERLKATLARNASS